MRKIAIFVVSVGLFLFTQNAYALDWVYNDNGDYWGDINTTGLTVGASNIDSPEKEWSPGAPVIQPMQISGAGTLLPAGSPGFRVNFHFNGSTWDSYNTNMYDYKTGYYDVFAAVLSEKGYYWSLPDIYDLHPLEENPAFILGLDPSNPTPGPDNSYWGGTRYNDGILENVDADVTLDFVTDPAKQYYLTLFMQTMRDENFPSWGTFTNVNVSAVPEPISTILFLSGGLLVGGRLLIKRRKK